jgi:hypothetical protein
MTVSTIDDSQRKAAQVAIFGVISSAWCVLCAFIFLIFPHFNKVVNDYIFDTPMALFELIVSFRLLFKGLSPKIQSTVEGSL